MNDEKNRYYLILLFKSKNSKNNWAENLEGDNTNVFVYSVSNRALYNTYIYLSFIAQSYR